MRWDCDLAFDARSRPPALEELGDARVNLIASRRCQRQLALARTEGDLERMREAARREADAGSRELQPMQQECELGGAAQTLLDACVVVLRNELHDLLDGAARNALPQRPGSG